MFLCSQRPGIPKTGQLDRNPLKEIYSGNKKVLKLIITC